MGGGVVEGMEYLGGGGGGNGRVGGVRVGGVTKMPESGEKFY